MISSDDVIHRRSMLDFPSEGFDRVNRRARKIRARLSRLKRERESIHRASAGFAKIHGPPKLEPKQFRGTNERACIPSIRLRVAKGRLSRGGLMISGSRNARQSSRIIELDDAWRFSYVARNGQMAVYAPCLSSTLCLARVTGRVSVPGSERPGHGTGAGEHYVHRHHYVRRERLQGAIANFEGESIIVF
jgi:hypothetical protein